VSEEKKYILLGDGSEVTVGDKVCAYNMDYVYEILFIHDNRFCFLWNGSTHYYVLSAELLRKSRDCDDYEKVEFDLVKALRSGSIPNAEAMAKGIVRRVIDLSLQLLAEEKVKWKEQQVGPNCNECKTKNVEERIVELLDIQEKQRKIIESLRGTLACAFTVDTDEKDLLKIIRRQVDWHIDQMDEGDFITSAGGNLFEGFDPKNISDEQRDYITCRIIENESIWSDVNELIWDELVEIGEEEAKENGEEQRDKYE